MLKMANGEKVMIEAVENCSLALPFEHILRLYKVLYFAKPTRNIISISILCKNCYNIQFNGNNVW